MSVIHPAEGVQVERKMGSGLSNDNAAIAETVIVPADQYGVLWKFWLDLDVASNTDLENLPAKLSVVITIGSETWPVDVHPYIEHTASGGTVFRHVDLGPWEFDFGKDGFYSGVLGDNIVINVPAAGTGIKSRIRFIYAGD